MDKVQCIPRGKYNLSINKWMLIDTPALSILKALCKWKWKGPRLKVLCRHLTFFFFIPNQTNFIDMKSRLMVMTF